MRNCRALLALCACWAVSGCATGLVKPTTLGHLGAPHSERSGRSSNGFVASAPPDDSESTEVVIQDEPPLPGRLPNLAVVAVAAIADNNCGQST